MTVEQVRSGGTDVIQAYSNPSNHLPGTITDAAGQDTDFTYNSAGQPLTVTNAKNETTTYTYETLTNNLLTVSGPVSGATTTYTYDAYNRIESVEDADATSSSAITTTSIASRRARIPTRRRKRSRMCAST